MQQKLVTEFKYVGVSILQLCAWSGCGTPQGYVKHMAKHHSDGKSLHQLLLFSVLLHHLHLLPCAVDDYELIGPPEYTGKMLHDIG